MKLDKSSNPALKGAFAKAAMDRSDSAPMTIQGTVNKTAFMMLLVLLGASFTWSQVISGLNAGPYMIGGLIGGLIFALITSFKPAWAPYTAPAYAVLEGLFLGGISAFFFTAFNGIVFQAVALTMGILFTMLFAYKTGLIKATAKFKRGVIMATGGVFFLYLISWIMGMFGLQVPFLHSGGLLGIGISLAIIVIAALNLILDFDFIEQSALTGAPKYMEWYGAFSVMVTLVWLYLEILRLLSVLSGND